MSKILEREVKKIGNSSHVTLPKNWVGKKVKVVLMNGKLTPDERENLIEQRENLIIVLRLLKVDRKYLSKGHTKLDEMYAKREIDIDNIIEEAKLSFEEINRRLEINLILSYEEQKTDDVK